MTSVSRFGSCGRCLTMSFGAVAVSVAVFSLALFEATELAQVLLAVLVAVSGGVALLHARGWGRRVNLSRT